MKFYESIFPFKSLNDQDNTNVFTNDFEKLTQLNIFDTYIPKHSKSPNDERRESKAEGSGSDSQSSILW